MKKISIAFFALVIALSSSVFAESKYGKAGQVELSPFFGMIFPEDYDTLQPNEAPIAGLRLGVWLSDSISWEFSGQRAFSEDGAGVNNVELDGYRGNLLWNINTGRGVRPFFTAGGGLERSNSTPFGAEYDWGFNGGAGFRFFAGENAGVRLEGRYATAKVNVGRATDTWQSNIEGDLGLFFLFGKKSKPAPAPAPVVAAAPKDTDNDGVVDEKDQCPGTPSDVKVDANGCVVANDDDKDGVTNADDKCPGTPENAPVDQTGCPLDSDADNVKDYMDKCPNTPAGTQVDDMGCPLQSKARGVLKGVTFMNNSPELQPNAKTVLDGVAAELKNFPEVKVEIQGHSDSMGDDAHNLALSQKRAESVLTYLTMQGVPAAQLTAKGYGESAPIADNKTAAGRANNRRVELKWLD
jgi:OOP family OmpA-OmpF porin